jgi:hypothetical protein
MKCVWNFDTTSAFALGPSKAMEKLNPSESFLCNFSVAFRCSATLLPHEFLSSGEIDRLRFPSIELYVPAVIARLHCSKFVLQF